MELFRQEWDSKGFCIYSYIHKKCTGLLGSRDSFDDNLEDNPDRFDEVKAGTFYDRYEINSITNKGDATEEELIKIMQAHSWNEESVSIRYTSYQCPYCHEVHPTYVVKKEQGDCSYKLGIGVPLSKSTTAYGICPNCYHRYNVDEVEEIRDYSDISDHSNLIAYWNESDDKVTLKILRNKIKYVPKDIVWKKVAPIDRVTIDIKSGRVWFGKYKGKSQEATHFDLDRDYWQDGYYIATKDYKKIAWQLHNYYQRTYPEYNTPLKHILSGVDLKLTKQSFVEVVRLVQAPYLSSQAFRNLRKVAFYIWKFKEQHQLLNEGEEPNYVLRDIWNNLRKLRVRKLSSQKEYSSVLGTKVNKIDVKWLLSKILPGYHKEIYATLEFLLQSWSEESFEVIVDLMRLFKGQSANNGALLYAKYYKDIHHYDLKDVARSFCKKLDIQSRDTSKYILEQVKDFFAGIASTYTTLINSEKYPGIVLPLGEVLEHKKDLDTVYDIFGSIFERGKISYMHNACTSLAIKIGIGDLPITYDDSMQQRIESNNQLSLVDAKGKHNYQIVLARSGQELYECTNALHICTVTYWERVHNGETNIAFIVDKTKRLGEEGYFEGCIEINNDYRVIQIKGRRNRSILPELKDFVRNWVKKCELDLVTSDLNQTECFRQNIGPNPYARYIEDHFRRAVFN